MNWLLDILRYIDCFFAWLIYRLVEVCYVIFAAMCRLNLQALGDALSPIVKRFQVFLGLVMLFVVAFELLKVIADPTKESSINDSILKRVGISIVLLVATISEPGVFDILSDFQNEILDQQVVEKAILGNGTEKTSSDLKTRYVGTGKYFAYSAFFAFYQNDDVRDSIMDGEPLETALSHVNDEDTKYYGYVINSVTGVLLGAMLISFAIDIGVRAFTLILLQILSPIPIILYITPKGEKNFSKYLTEYFKVYAELFLKIAICYLSLYLLSVVTESLFGNGILSAFGSNTLFEGLNDMSILFWGLLYAVLIVAIFFFSRSVPNLIGQLFSKNGQGLFSGRAFNPFSVTRKALGLAAGLGIGVPIGAATGAVTGLAAGGLAALRNGGTVRDALHAAANGAGNGATHGFNGRIFTNPGSYYSSTAGNITERHTAEAQAEHDRQLSDAQEAEVRAQDQLNKSQAEEAKIQEQITATNTANQKIDAIKDAAAQAALRNGDLTDGTGYDSVDEAIAGETAEKRTERDKAKSIYDEARAKEIELTNEYYAAGNSGNSAATIAAGKKLAAQQGAVEQAKMISDAAEAEYQRDLAEKTSQISSAYESARSDFDTINTHKNDSAVQETISAYNQYLSDNASTLSGSNVTAATTLADAAQSFTQSIGNLQQSLTSTRQDIVNSQNNLDAAHQQVVNLGGGQTGNPAGNSSGSNGAA